MLCISLYMCTTVLVSGRRCKNTPASRRGCVPRTTCYQPCLTRAALDSQRPNAPTHRITPHVPSTVQALENQTRTM